MNNLKYYIFWKKNYCYRLLYLIKKRKILITKTKSKVILLLKCFDYQINVFISFKLNNQLTLEALGKSDLGPLLFEKLLLPFNTRCFLFKGVDKSL